jgi:cell wall-associated NlpC family hydrolase
MRKLILIFFLLISITNCKSSKRTKKRDRSSSSKQIVKSTSNNNTNKYDAVVNTDSNAQNIVRYAKQFEGVKYKWGGATELGMDCSGLVFESFRKFEIYLPRISRDMAKKGRKISLTKVKDGDLLFFRTKNRRNAINHVGLVVSSKNGKVKFIHATSSNGVITSFISESYWSKIFVEARKIL